VGTQPPVLHPVSRPAPRTFTDLDLIGADTKATTATTRKQRRQAALRVVEAAVDHEEARMFLSMLGLEEL
jgi:hypothetical protein